MRTFQFLWSCMVLLFGVVSSTYAEPSSFRTDISQGWKLRLGDEPSWADPAFDDSDWQAVRPGVAWEKQGHADYNGYGWYRLHMRIPGTFRSHPDFKQHQALNITLGKVDDVDQTWFNGKMIGKTGGFPDAYRPDWLTTRVYRVPSDLVRWDSDNVIAVRVYDGDADGGMYEGPYHLECASWKDFVKLELDLGRNDGIFDELRGMPIAGIWSNETESRLAGHVLWTIADDEGQPLSTTSDPTVLPPQGMRRVECQFSPKGPGFYRVACALRSEGQDVNVASSIVLGHRPEEVQSPLTRERDFDEFWRKTLEDLSAVAPQFEMIRKPTLDSATHEVFEVTMRSLGEVRVRGWYERPKVTGTYPALLRVPGYGSNMQPTGSSDLMAFFSFNVRGHGNSQDDIRGAPQDFWIRGLDNKQGYYYQGAYADCVRAVDFLVSRTEIDPQRIAITGGSQGGGLSLITAALDHRIRLCAPDIPFLCDWHRYFKTTKWPEMESWIEARSDRSWESTLRTMSYFDALNHADRIQCPVFVGLGLQDETCPPATIFAVYNRLEVPKRYRVYPHAKHWVDASHDAARRKWIWSYFRR